MRWEEGQEMGFQNAVECLCYSLRRELERIPAPLQEDCREIRLRKDVPLVLVGSGGSRFLTQSGQATREYGAALRVVSGREMAECFEVLCENSVYSHQNEIAQGFLSTIAGHRAGICGTAVVENGRIISLRNITSINLRIVRRIAECANDLLKAPIWKGREGILLVGEPSSGKTTLLRDLAGQLSVGARGEALQVSVMDERGELSGVSGKIGLCDVLRGYPKAEGILQALRSMSPQVIVCDEVSTKEEIARMAEGMHAGCQMIATVHAHTVEDFWRRPACVELLKTGAFRWVVFLRGRCAVGQIDRIWKAEDLWNEMVRDGFGGVGRRLVGDATVSTIP